MAPPKTPARQRDWRELAESAPGTPMGTLLRRFWQPVAMASEVAAGHSTRVRILNQDLALSRDGAGQPRAEGCPAREYAGLVFAYLGEGPPPDFPRRPELERGYGVQWQVKMTWPCNWFQRVENSMDGVHVSFVHRDAPFGQAVTPAVPRLEFEETAFGMIQRAHRGEGNVRESHWQFPNCNHVVVPRADDAWSTVWADNFGYKLPVDDEHTVEFVVTDVPVAGEAADRLRAWVAKHARYDPSEHEAELLQGVWPEQKTYLIPAQDYLAQVFQGVIADRSQEHLGKSDAGVILMRQIFWRELDAIKRGLPGKQWLPEAQMANLPVPPGVAERAALAGA